MRSTPVPAEPKVEDYVDRHTHQSGAGRRGCGESRNDLFRSFPALFGLSSPVRSRLWTRTDQSSSRNSRGSTAVVVSAVFSASEHRVKTGRSPMASRVILAARTSAPIPAASSITNPDASSRTLLIPPAASDAFKVSAPVVWRVSHGFGTPPVPPACTAPNRQGPA